MKEIEEDLSGIPQEHHQLFRDVRDKIMELIEERKLKWLSETIEFREGVEVGLEIAAFYGDKISEIYKKSNSDNDSSDS